MKISKYLMIDENIKLQKFHLSQIKNNKCKKDFYLLCIPNHEKYLFEIIKGQHLNKKYEEYYLIGLAKEQDVIRDYLKQLVDQMYNINILEYKELKT